jgi:hypothetical protein
MEIFMDLMDMLPVIIGIVLMIYLRQSFYITSPSKFGELMRTGLAMTSLQGGFVGFIIWMILWWVITDIIRFPLIFVSAFVLPTDFAIFVGVVASIVIADIIATIAMALGSKFLQ